MSDADDAPAPPRTAKRHQGLGRGLSALFAETSRDVDLRATNAREGGGSGNGEADAGANERAVRLIDIASIRPHPDQPRRHFAEEALRDLAESIAARGVIQPIIVRPDGAAGYQIVAGERRWRAAQRAQLHRIPAIVRDFSETETLEIALVENIQREDLNPIEEALAYRRLIAHFGHSQEALGRIVGKSRSHLANTMRLLDLPQAVQDHVMSGALSMGHARALIGAEGAEALADRIISGGLSVRETEKLVQAARGGPRPVRRPAASTASLNGADADMAALERDLTDLLGMRVAIAGAGQKGTLTISYATLDQLDMLCQRLSGQAF